MNANIMKVIYCWRSHKFTFMFLMNLILLKLSMNENINETLPDNLGRDLASGGLLAHCMQQATPVG